MSAYDQNNIFAKILRGEIPSHKIYEDGRALAFMDIMPRTEGHVLVIPKTAVRNLLDVSPEDLGYVMGVVQMVARAAVKATGADGFTIQQFNEEAGGQVVFHLHFHILPRWAGVALRPPASEVEKPDVLAATAEKIRKALAELVGGVVTEPAPAAAAPEPAPAPEPEAEAEPETPAEPEEAEEPAAEEPAPDETDAAEDTENPKA
jgi:histidine triad (HIT) family protein